MTHYSCRRCGAEMPPVPEPWMKKPYCVDCRDCMSPEERRLMVRHGAL